MCRKLPEVKRRSKSVCVGRAKREYEMSESSPIFGSNLCSCSSIEINCLATSSSAHQCEIPNMLSIFYDATFGMPPPLCFVLSTCLSWVLQTLVYSQRVSSTNRLVRLIWGLFRVYWYPSTYCRKWKKQGIKGTNKVLELMELCSYLANKVSWVLLGLINAVLLLKTWGVSRNNISKLRCK